MIYFFPLSQCYLIKTYVLIYTNMKGKRTDLEIQAEIIERLINWELGSVIAKDLWVHESTVSRIKDSKLQEVASESKIVASLIDTNNNLQSLADARLQDMLADWEETIRISELVQVRESTFKQNQLLTWNATENYNILWDVLSEIQWLK